MKAGDIASAIGKGLVAGAVGTVAMTASQIAAQRLVGQEASDAPAKAAGKVLGVQPRDPAGKERFSYAVHFGYGAGWGVPRGLLAMSGVTGPTATAIHFLLVWGSALALLPRLRVAPSPTEWEPTELAVDAFHHLVYAVAAGAAFEALDRRTERAELRVR